MPPSKPPPSPPSTSSATTGPPPRTDTSQRSYTMKRYLRTYDRSEASFAGHGAAGYEREEATRQKLQAWNITWDHMAGRREGGQGSRS